MRLFFWAVFFSTIAFFILAYSASKVCSWNLGESFIQLTNPTRHIDGPLKAGDSVLLNLFGLFVLNGLILTIFVNWVSNRKDRHANGEAHYPHIQLKRFSVIIGGYKMVASLAHSLIKRENLDAEIVRKEIYAEINDESLVQNVIIYSGDRTFWHELEGIQLNKAQKVYVIGESFHIEGSNHDAINLQCWNLTTDPASYG